jgi:hypothetical protein
MCDGQVEGSAWPASPRCVLKGRRAAGTSAPVRCGTMPRGGSCLSADTQPLRSRWGLASRPLLEFCAACTRRDSAIATSGIALCGRLRWTFGERVASQPAMQDRRACTRLPEQDRSHRTEAAAPKKKARFPGLFCERGTGLEPATLSLGNTRSTAWIGRLRSTMRKRTRWNPLEPARAGWSLAHASGPSRCSEPVADLVQLESNGSRRTPAACRFSRRDKERGFVVAALATRAHCLAWEQSCLDGKQVLAGPCSGLGPANLKYPVDIGSPCRPAPPEGL